MSNEFAKLFAKTGGKPSARSQYGWFSIIDSLAGNDILKFNAVTELSFRQCFIKLQMMKDESIENSKKK
ncbi:MAG: hypothetical protein Unbinned6486contig1001_4 [Prokaryotic dsDNA virus sp.]|nr:MAG: hypothetical protein Unbinned6486contig1001_4 [Prokaryotic dsDNA virus sp.]